MDQGWQTQKKRSEKNYHAEHSTGRGSRGNHADGVPMDISEEAEKKVPTDGKATTSPNWWKDMRARSNRQEEGRGKGKGTKGCSADHKVVPQGSKLAADDHDFYAKYDLVSCPVIALTALTFQQM